MRIDAIALETCDVSAEFSFCSLSCFWSSLFTATFARSTATLTATTPASRSANAAIQRMPGVTRRVRRRVLARGFGAATGRARRRAGAGAATASAANQSTVAKPTAPCFVERIRETASRFLFSRVLHRSAQPGRRCARVRRDLGLGGPYGTALDRAQLGLVTANTDREVGRARAAPLALAQEVLDDPVFERMKRDDREPAAGAEHRERGGQRRFERAELVVHCDAQCLEDALRGMPFAEARRCGDRRPDRVHELGGALERLLAAAADDRLCDLPRVTLLAELAEDGDELLLGPLVDDRACVEVLGRVHPHVERRVGRVRESALGTVELHRRDAEVEQDRIRRDAVLRQLREHDAEVAAEETRLHAAAALEPLEIRAHRRVAVDRDQLAAAAEVADEQRRVAACSEGRVDD